MLFFRRLFLVATIGLALSCTFNPGLNPKDYWPCQPDGDCPGECECFDGRICIPPNTDDDPVVCKWCEPGHIDCDELAGTGCEVDPATDPKNCGDCFIECPGGWLCEVGTCVQECREGFVQCGGGCIDPLHDPDHCGGCDQPCNSSQVCDGGACKGECAEDLTDCDGSCTDIKSDPENCGRCGRLCVLPNARPKCELGVCLVDTCIHPFGDCDRQEPGCETNLKESAADCGSCGNACGVNMECLGGICACNHYFADCDENPDTGCEIMIKTDPMNCGECGNVCDTPPADYCEEDYLVVHSRLGQCAEFTCNYEPAPTFCEHGCLDGQCLGDPCAGVSCDEGEECINGVCACGATGPDCIGEQVCCGTECVVVWNNPDHCGDCFVTCGQNAFCEGTSCQCVSQEFADCNTSWADGCETNLRESAENCGECGNICGQNAVCVSGQCDCEDGYGNCDGGWHNGCEVDLNTPGNCGYCGLDCPAGEVCCEGICTNLAQDDLNCGTCENSCPAGNLCCDASCTDTSTSIEHCGTCFNACVGNYTCSQGSCGKVGVECADGTLCNPLQGEMCCYSSGGNMECSIANDCSGHMFDCNGPEDCDSGYVCCAVMETMETTSCMLAQDCPSALLCTSDLQCQESNPDNPMCCPENIQGVDVYVCMSACP